MVVAYRIGMATESPKNPTRPDGAAGAGGRGSEETCLWPADGATPLGRRTDGGVLVAEFEGALGRGREMTYKERAMDALETRQALAECHHEAALERIHKRVFRAYVVCGQKAKAEEVRQLVLRDYGIDLAEIDIPAVPPWIQ